MASVKIKGGDKLAKALANLSRKLSKPGTLRVGFLENSTHYKGGQSPAEVATYQEFGTPNAQFPIPPRPFFRNMIKNNEGTWAATLEKYLREYDGDTEKALKALGLEMEAQLRDSIIDIQAPPLSEVTLILRQMRRKDPDLKVTRQTVVDVKRRVDAGEKSGLSGTGAKPLIDPSAGEDSGLLLKSVASEVKT